MKLYISSNTTGLNPVQNGMVDLAVLLVNSNGESFEQFYTINAHYAEIDDTALAINGYNKDDICEFDNIYSVMEDLITFINTYRLVGEKVTLVHYTDFSLKFLKVAFKRYHPKGYSSWDDIFTYKNLDIFQLVLILTDLHIIDTGSSQGLKAVSDYFQVPIIQYDSVSQVKALYSVYDKLAMCIHTRAMNNGLTQGVCDDK